MSHMLTMAAPQTSRTQDGYHVDSLIGIILGVTMKKYHPITILPNICKYCPITQSQYHSNPSLDQPQLLVNGGGGRPVRQCLDLP